ncbi:dolichyl-phosphate mannose synthase [Lysobacter helvus]|uniref:Dolichyl-phosphate mannose synthase n=2 Tax=Lysobacteraceae TaxID=32033 RepID=A0ABN6FR47_9GAMM|nr:MULTISPECIES: glycosyltransferase family 2 protein [Lysobacter]BCT92122.1 dolichyl-phosphate mannose synthase [Lysobacter caseinilyticus]BCT95275.1 dolichyl-phosphate mannose synthase [Lysobacter helvus]
MRDAAALAQRTCVVIPALNEQLRIREVVEGALAQCPNVIVIDDGSDDGTSDRIADLPIILLRHEERQGKGHSLREGFAEAMRRGFDGVLTMDGDGQHLAEDLPRLLDAAVRFPGALVIGSRLRKRSQQPLYRRLANEFGDWGISIGCGYQISDTQSGQRYYPANVCALDDVPGEDFVFEAQILMSASRKLGTRVVSVPIESRYQSPEVGALRKSHFRPLRDLWRITSHVTRHILSYGQLRADWRNTRAHPPVIHDPTGEFAPPPPSLHQASFQERS